MPSTAIPAARPLATATADVARPLAGHRPADAVTAPLPLGWLVRLRWAAVVAQAVIVALAWWNDWLVAPVPVAALVSAGAASNVALMLAGRSAAAVDRGLTGSALLFDVLLLTAILGLAGGPANPFSLVYLVYVTLAAVLLGAGWTWLIVAAAVAGHASLFAWHLPLSPHVAHASGMPSHFAGMWIAFSASATLIAIFVTGVTRTLARREEELRELRRMSARQERLASLTTLAAGAAHELATPLATIAVVAHELQRSAAAQNASELLGDATVIRTQVDRCRDILDQMSGRAGQASVDPPGYVDVPVLLDELRARLPQTRAARLDVEGATGLTLTTPRAGLQQALLNLLGNAFDASSDSQHVTIGVETVGRTVRFAIVDRGAGIPVDTLERIGEPFFTTKPTGAGYGLGVFLSRVFADRQGGSLTYDSLPGRGTTAVLELPLEPRA